MGCQFPLTDLCSPPGKEGGRGRVASEYMVAEMCNAPLGNCPPSPISTCNLAKKVKSCGKSLRMLQSACTGVYDH